MKELYLLLLLIAFGLNSFGQKLTDTLKNQPDGLTISYFDTQDTSCQSTIFIGDNFQVIISCSRRGYQRIDISAASSEIKRLKEILTIDFMNNLNKCCYEKNCGDTFHAYVFRIKKGDIIRDAYLDIAFTVAGKCGNSKLDELIEIYNTLIKSYH